MVLHGLEDLHTGVQTGGGGEITAGGTFMQLFLTNSIFVLHVNARPMQQCLRPLLRRD